MHTDITKGVIMWIFIPVVWLKAKAGTYMTIGNHKIVEIDDMIEPNKRIFISKRLCKYFKNENKDKNYKEL